MGMAQSRSTPLYPKWNRTPLEGTPKKGTPNFGTPPPPPPYKDHGNYPRQSAAAMSLSLEHIAQREEPGMVARGGGVRGVKVEGRGRGSTGFLMAWLFFRGGCGICIWFRGV